MPRDVQRQVTCVIVSYHRVDAARRAVSRLAHPDIDVVLVNVESDPDIAAIPGDHRVVGLEGNPGYAAAVNAGVAVAHADLVVFANDDAAISAAGVFALVAPIVDGRADVTVPRVVGADGEVVRTIATIPTPASLVREWVLLPDRPVPTLAGRVRVEKWRAPRSPERINAAAAVVVAAHRALLAEEPLPEEYFLYWEESEWFWRLRERGVVVQYRPDVACVHSGGRGDVRPEKSRLMARNAIRCVRRTQGRAAALVTVGIVIGWNLRLVLTDLLRALARPTTGRRARLHARWAGLGAAATSWGELR
jgi:GT2 family glycosyltransferase